MNFKRKIGLIDIDGHNFPNLALMKISAYHKKNGDNVHWVDIGNYDITYISKVFTFSPNFIQGFGNYGKIVKGGSGFGMTKILPFHIDKLCPDYSIYPKFTNAYGFLTRGCPNKCNWCIVPKKEGNIMPYSDIEDFLQDRKNAILMDNNVLAHEHGLKQIEKIIKLGIKVDFNQGLDARLITKDIAKLLSKVKWIDKIRLSCDSETMLNIVLKAISYFKFKPHKFLVYMLLNDNLNSAYNIASIFRKNKIRINPQPFRDFKNKRIIFQWEKDFSRWGNKHEIYMSCDFKDYIPRKGFVCKKYFEKEDEF